MNTRGMAQVYPIYADLLSLPGIQRVSDAFAEEVVAQDGNEDRETGEGREPPGDFDIVLARREEAPPGGSRRLDAETEEAQRRLDEDGASDSQGGRDEDGRQAVRQDVLHDDASVSRADGVGRYHELPFLERDELGANEPRRLHPTREPDHGHDVDDARLEDGDHGKHQEDRRDGEHDVHQPHDHSVYPAAVITGDGAKDDSDDGRDADRHEAHLERYPSSPEHARENVPSQFIRTQRMGPA